MEDSTEKSKKLHAQTTDDGGDCCFCLPICNCNSLLQPFIFIMRFLGFKRHTLSSSAAYCRLSSSPEVSHTAASDPPPTAAFPSTDQSGLESEFSRRFPPPPLRSTGGGGQIN